MAQVGVKLRSSWGQVGVKLGSRHGQLILPVPAAAVDTTTLTVCAAVHTFTIYFGCYMACSEDTSGIGM